MAEKSLSAQDVADILRVSKSTVYDLIRKGEIYSYNIGRKVRFMQEDVDAYIARSRHERSVRSVQTVNTHSALLSPQDEGPELVISGQDAVLDILASFLQREEVAVGRAYLSGFEGLLALYEDRVQAAACHLYDGQEYNRSYVRSLMPGIGAVLVNVSYRTLGFYVRKGNPLGITAWEDLGRKGLGIINRRCGSSARIVLDIKLKELGISTAALKGYDNIVKSHLTIAAAVANGEADLALGTERISRQMDGIDFIPLLEERFDLAIKKDTLEKHSTQQLLEVMASPVFRREIAHLSGNDYRDLGKIVAEV